MNLPELFLGQILEAIYFALFMIFTKQLKTKRLLFIVLMILDEIMLVKLTDYSIRFYVLYVVFTFLILKVLYKNQVQIIDVFVFMIGSIVMLVVNAVTYLLILVICKKFIIYAILSRLVLFTFLLVFKNKLPSILKLYGRLWNRNDKVKKKIKTTTFRSINIAIFNCMFYLAHIILIFEITRKGGV